MIKSYAHLSQESCFEDSVSANRMKGVVIVRAPHYEYDECCFCLETLSEVEDFITHIRQKAHDAGLDKH